MKVILLSATALIALAGFAFTHSRIAPSLTTDTTGTTVVSVSSPQLNPVTAANNYFKAGSKQVFKEKVNPSRVLYLDEQVTFGSSTALVNKIKDLNAKSSDDIFLLIDSPGGSVLDGAMLVSEMEASKSHVNTVCTRLCASMAAMIHAHGYKRFNTDRSILMYHPASAGAQGQVPNMLSQMGTISRFLDKMVALQVSRSKMTLEDFNRRVAYEFWVDAEDAVSLGLSDGIINLNVPSQEPVAPVVNVTISPSPETPVPTPEAPAPDTKKSIFKPRFDIDWISPNLYLWDHDA